MTQKKELLILTHRLGKAIHNYTTARTRLVFVDVNSEPHVKTKRNAVTQAYKKLQAYVNDRQLHFPGQTNKLILETSFIISSTAFCSAFYPSFKITYYWLSYNIAQLHRNPIRGASIIGNNVSRLLIEGHLLMDKDKGIKLSPRTTKYLQLESNTKYWPWEQKALERIIKQRMKDDHDTAVKLNDSWLSKWAEKNLLNPDNSSLKLLYFLILQQWKKPLE